MTPDDLAVLHGRCFTVPKPFTAASFAGFLNSENYFLNTATGGFSLGRLVADEAELLTIAVDPIHRRSGIGRKLLVVFEHTAAARGASKAFLEVAAGNSAAITLYKSAGYRESGQRRGYYCHPNGVREDAILMEKTLSGE